MTRIRRTKAELAAGLTREQVAASRGLSVSHQETALTPEGWPTDPSALITALRDAVPWDSHNEYAARVLEYATGTCDDPELFESQHPDVFPSRKPLTST